MITKTNGERLLSATIKMLAGQTGYTTRSTRELRTLVDELAPGRVDREKARQASARAKAHEAARWTGKVPAWAKRLINKHAPRYNLIWRISQTKGYSSGRCKYFTDTIIVTAGSDEVEQKAVLLHEIAHTKAPYDDHGEKFWDALYRLAVAEGHVEAVKDRSTNGFTLAQRRARKARARTAGHTAVAAIRAPESDDGPESLKQLLRIR